MSVAHWYVQFASILLLWTFTYWSKIWGAPCSTAPPCSSTYANKEARGARNLFVRDGVRIFLIWVVSRWLVDVVDGSNWVVVLKENVVCFNFLIGGGADIAILVGLADNSNITLHTCTCNSGGPTMKFGRAHAHCFPPPPVPTSMRFLRVFTWRFKMYQYYYFIYKIYRNLKMKRSLETSCSTNTNQYINY